MTIQFWLQLQEIVAKIMNPKVYFEKKLSCKETVGFLHNK